MKTIFPAKIKKPVQCSGILGKQN